MVYNDLIDINLLGRFWNNAKQHLPSGGGGDVPLFDDYDTNIWTIGTFSSANGTTATSTTRMRTEILSKAVKKVRPAAGYKAAFWVYDASGTYQGVWNGTEAVKSVVVWFTETVDFSDMPSGSQVRVLAADTNDSTITDSTLSTFAQGVILTRYTDDSLSHSGYPADAAATAAMFGTALLSRGTLTSSDNLNSVTFPGIYFAGRNYSGAGGFPSNLPTGVTGDRIRVLVVRTEGSVAGAWQTFVDGAGMLWIRGFSGAASSGSWSAWQKTPTISEVSNMIDAAILGAIEGSY